MKVRKSVIIEKESWKKLKTMANYNEISIADQLTKLIDKEMIVLKKNNEVDLF